MLSIDRGVGECVIVARGTWATVFYIESITARVVTLAKSDGGTVVLDLGGIKRALDRDSGVSVALTKIDSNKAYLAIDAPADVTIMRPEALGAERRERNRRYGKGEQASGGRAREHVGHSGPNARDPRSSRDRPGS